MSNVKIEDMVWPLPDGDLEYALRYVRPSAELSEVSRFRAADILAAYAQMVRDPQKKRQMVIREIRKALREK